MDLFDTEIFVEVKNEPQEEARDIQTELDVIIKRHNLNAPDELLQELAGLWLDPPPWAPWS